VPVDAVQLALVPLIDQPRQWCDAVEVLRACGVRVLSGMMSTIGEDYSTLESIARTGGFRADATWHRNLDRALRLADLCADHGVTLVTTHAGFIPESEGDPLHPIMVERVRKIADVFARRGVVLALETGQERADTLVGFLRAADRSNLGVNFDPANMILYGMGDPTTSLEALAPWVRQIHVKDALPTERPGTWGREVPVGTGAVDWGRLGEVVRRLDPPVDLVIEREAGGQRLDDVKRAVAIARTMISAESRDADLSLRHREA